LILLFGGGGQLAQELVRLASARGIVLTALNHAELDIADSTAVAAAFAKHRPALAINAAAYNKVDLAETEFEQARRGNEIGPAVLADRCHGTDVPLVHVSTDYVFDGTKSSAYAETDQIHPINIYGLTKAAGEENIRRRLRRHIMLRTGWVYGEFGHNFLKTIVRLANTREELRIVSDQTGTPTSTRMLADAILRIAPRLLIGENIWGTYHFSATGRTTWHGFATRIVAAQAPLTGRNPKVTAITSAEYSTPARRPVNSVLDCSRFVQVFGIRADPWAEEVDAVTRAFVAAQQGVTAHVA
jgi:dTDP-4-dehydrorhamnose reductase